MSDMKAPENTPVWVNTSRCKACNICVANCPAGVLGMIESDTTIMGTTISVDFENSCIGCNACELSCPDFAIYVASRKEFKFSKLTDEAKQREEKIIQNKYMSIKEDNNG